MGERKPPPDWERIEAEYRAGVLSLREIASVHGLTEGAVRKRAKRDEWVRDLAAKVRARTDDLVRKQAVRSEVRNRSAVTERVLIESNAQVIAQIRSQHRGDIGRSRALCMALLAELENQTGSLPDFLDLGDLLRAPNEGGVDKLNDVYRAVISLPERTKTLKALAESLRHLVGLEREAYGLPVSSADVGGNTCAPSLASLTAEEAARQYQQFISGG